MIRSAALCVLLALLAQARPEEKPAEKEAVPAPAHVLHLRECVAALNKVADLRHVAVSTDGMGLSVYSAKSGLIVYDLRTGMQRFTVPASKAEVTALATSPTGEWTAVGRADGTLSCYRAGAEKVEDRHQTADRPRLRTIAFVTGDEFVAAGWHNVTLYSLRGKPHGGVPWTAVDSWELEANVSVARGVGADDKPLLLVSLVSGPNVKQVAWLSSRGKVSLLPAQRGAGWCIAIHPTRAVIATADSSGSLRIYPGEHFPERFQQLEISKQGLVSLAFSSLTPALAIVDGRGRCSCWDYQTGKQVLGPERFPTLPGLCTHFGYILGGKALLSIGKEVRLFDPETGAEYRFPSP